MTDEQYTRWMEIALRVIQTWTSGSTCYTCQTINQKCREVLAFRPEPERTQRPYEPGLD